MSVAFHPSVLKDFGIDSGLAAERRMLVSLALDFVCDAHKITVSRDYTLLSKEEPCMGPVNKAQQSLTKKFTNQEDAFEKELGELEKMFGPATAGCKESLLSEMSNITSGQEPTQDSSSCDLISAASAQTGIKIPNVSSKSDPQQKGLIEEISSSVSESKLPEPDYDLSVNEMEGDKPRRVVVKIKLPGVTSVSDCQLDVSQVRLGS